MVRPKTRKIAGQSHLKSKSVSVSGYATKHGKKVKSYSSHRWKRKHKVRTVILPANRRSSISPSGSQRTATDYDGGVIPDRPSFAPSPEVFELFGEGDPRATARSKEVARVREIERMQEDILTNRLGEIDFERKQEEATIAATRVIDEERQAAERLEEVKRQLADAKVEAVRDITINSAYDKELRFNRDQQKDQNLQIIDLQKQILAIRGDNLSSARHKELSTRLDALNEFNDDFFKVRRRQLLEENEPNGDVRMAKLASLQAERDRRRQTINNAKVVLDNTQVKNPNDYSSILTAISIGNEETLQRKGLYHLLPESRFSRTARRVKKEDRVYSEMEKRASTLKYLDYLNDEVNYAVKVGKWTEPEVKRIKREIGNTRIKVLERTIKDTTVTEDQLRQQSDLKLQQYIADNRDFEQNARTYSRRVKSLAVVSEVFKERRTFAEALLKNRQGEEQLRRPRTINALTDYFNKNLSSRDRENVFNNRKVKEIYNTNMKLGRSFDDPKKKEFYIENSRFHADVHAAIRRSEYLKGYTIGEGTDKEHIKGAIQLHRELKIAEKQKLSPQLREWAELHPEIEFGQGVPYDNPAVSPELAQLGATIDLKDLKEAQLIESRRDPLGDQDTDFTLGLFKHPKKKKRRHKGKK